MKQIRFYMLIVLSLLINSANAHSIDEIRKQYQLAVESPSVTEKLSKELNNITKPDALTLAYIASLEALKAKHSLNPYLKLNYLSSFDKRMSEAIKRMPNNMEIRFLRYTIQYNTPSFLGYSKNLDEDKKVIIDAFLKKRFVTHDKSLINNVYLFMVETKSVTQEEKSKMEKVLQQL